MLSIVIPTLNESKTGYLPRILKAYASISNCQILCVDGGSSDDTINVVNKSSAKLIESDQQSRAGRLNEGIALAEHDLILLHHPRSILPLEGINYLISRSSELKWGAFTHSFDVQHPLLAFTSWYSNNIRGDWRKIYYLDHCLFAQKSLLEAIGMVPNLEIFEDTALCENLKRKAAGTRLPFLSVTSAVRFTRNNMYKQALMNQKLKWQYYLNYSNTKMNQRYERGLELNTQYKDKNKQ